MDVRIGAIVAWRQLVTAGVYVQREPGRGVLHVFTVAHAVHLLGGIFALLLRWISEIWPLLR